MFKRLEELAGGKSAAARVLGIPYTSSYAGYASGRRPIPLYITFAIEALLRLPKPTFQELLESRNYTPAEERSWVVLMEGPKGSVSPNGVAYAGSTYESRESAAAAAKRLREFGFKGARAVHRPHGVDLAFEPPLAKKPDS